MKTISSKRERLTQAILKQLLIAISRKIPMLTVRDLKGSIGITEKTSPRMLRESIRDAIEDRKILERMPGWVYDSSRGSISNDKIKPNRNRSLKAANAIETLAKEEDFIPNELKKKITETVERLLRAEMHRALEPVIKGLTVRAVEDVIAGLQGNFDENIKNQ